ncbi:MAG: NAD(P)-dependent oxidoreductase [Alphaproteobacteria bacterium]|nr:NAD(P)-dependent oxidoreductase [Alphaproteobacteria bacterium]
MATRMLKFVSVDRSTPEKRPAAERVGDFHEIYKGFIEAKAEEQASRCSQCGVPFCQVHCPVQNNIPDWLKLVAEGRMEEAYELSISTNTLPEVCGRICPQDRLCEGNCVIEQSGHGTVTIGAVEAYIFDTAWARGLVRAIKPRHERAESVGIIGAGPAGIAAADRLRRKGFQVHIYDRYDRAGGLLIYGIPNFKLEKEIVLRRAELLAESGVVFHMNTEIGRDVTLEALRERHEAVLIATGVYAARDLKLPGAGLKGVWPAMSFLTTSNRQGLGDAVPEFEDGTLNAHGKDVVVIGGGDTAMDCVRTALRQGAKSVKCLYRRDRANMPGSMREVAHAEEEGVDFVWLAAPKALLGEGTVSGVRSVKMRLGLPEATGRRQPEEVPSSDFTVPADLVIKALGFDPEDLPTLFGAPELGVTRWSTVKADLRSMMTNLPGVFAAGDIVRGASLVVWAVRDGQDAAGQIEAFLNEKARSATASVAAE